MTDSTMPQISCLRDNLILNLEDLVRSNEQDLNELLAEFKGCDDLLEVVISIEDKARSRNFARRKCYQWDGSRWIMVNC
jgi:hypothetical protein